MIAGALKRGWAGAFYKTISFTDIKEVSLRFDSVDKGNVSFKTVMPAFLNVK